MLVVAAVYVCVCVCVYFYAFSLSLSSQVRKPTRRRGGRWQSLRYDVVLTATDPFRLVHFFRHHPCYAIATAFGVGVLLGCIGLRFGYAIPA